jgi:aldehyde dehydrogenase (NAD+)
MLKMAELIERDAEKLAKYETICMGQPIQFATKFCASTPQYWRYYAGFCDKLGGECFPDDGDGRVKMTQYAPFGVCAGIGMDSLPRAYDCGVADDITQRPGMGRKSLL